MVRVRLEQCRLGRCLAIGDGRFSGTFSGFLDRVRDHHLTFLQRHGESNSLARAFSTMTASVTGKQSLQNQASAGVVLDTGQSTEGTIDSANSKSATKKKTGGNRKNWLAEYVQSFLQHMESIQCGFEFFFLPYESKGGFLVRPKGNSDGGWVVLDIRYSHDLSASAFSDLHKAVSSHVLGYDVQRRVVYWLPKAALPNLTVASTAAKHRVDDRGFNDLLQKHWQTQERKSCCEWVVAENFVCAVHKVWAASLHRIWATVYRPLGLQVHFPAGSSAANTILDGGIPVSHRSIFVQRKPRTLYRAHLSTTIDRKFIPLTIDVPIKLFIFPFLSPTDDSGIRGVYVIPKTVLIDREYLACPIRGIKGQKSLTLHPPVDGNDADDATNSPWDQAHYFDLSTETARDSSRLSFLKLLQDQR